MSLRLVNPISTDLVYPRGLAVNGRDVVLSPGMFV
jgi:hypothetical protein